MMIRYTVLLILLLLIGGVPALAKDPAFVGNRVLFLGDSITQEGTYVSLVEYYLETRYPAQTFDIISIGLASETASGLSESAHPFPRPCVHERLEAALRVVKPDIVVACYGMNDGIYHPPSAERMRAFQAGIKALIAKCQRGGAQVILLTPPPFDPIPVRARTLPANAPDFSYLNPFEGYDAVLQEYGAWERTLPHSDAQVVDIHTPLAHYIAEQRRKNPGFALSPDAIHPSPVGHLQIAAALLKAIGVEVRADDREWERVGADSLYQLVARRRKLRSEGWLSYVGYTRDGVFKTDSITETERESAELQKQIDQLRRMFPTRSAKR